MGDSIFGCHVLSVLTSWTWGQSAPQQFVDGTKFQCSKTGLIFQGTLAS